MRRRDCLSGERVIYDVSAWVNDTELMYDPVEQRDDPDAQDFWKYAGHEAVVAEVLHEHRIMSAVVTGYILRFDDGHELKAGWSSVSPIEEQSDDR